MIVVPPEALRKSSFMHRYARKRGALFRIFKPGSVNFMWDCDSARYEIKKEMEREA
jgi:hypothetical protein